MSNLIENSGFWTVIGVLIGLLVGEGVRIVREKIRISRLKNMIKSELKSIKSQIPQMIDIIKKTIIALEKLQILPGQHVPILSIGYKSSISFIYNYLKPKERNILHVIYSSLEVADKTVENYENVYHLFKTQGRTDGEIAKILIGIMTDILDNYNIINDLIDSYLEGNPIDVFHVNKLHQT